MCRPTGQHRLSWRDRKTQWDTHYSQSFLEESVKSELNTIIILLKVTPAVTVQRCRFVGSTRTAGRKLSWPPAGGLAGGTPCCPPVQPSFAAYCQVRPGGFTGSTRLSPVTIQATIAASRVPIDTAVEATTSNFWLSILEVNNYYIEICLDGNKI